MDDDVQKAIAAARAAAARLSSGLPASAPPAAAPAAPPPPSGPPGMYSSDIGRPDDVFARTIAAGREAAMNEVASAPAEGAEGAASGDAAGGAGGGMDDVLARVRAAAAAVGGAGGDAVLGKRPTPSGDYNVRERLSRIVPVPVRDFPDVNFLSLLVGKDGSNHKKMEQESGARLKFRGRGTERPGDPPDTQDMHVIVEADEKEVLKKGIEVVEALLKDPKTALAARGEDPAPPPTDFRGAKQLAPGETATEIFIPDHMVGLIIGRGGENIRELQDRTGANIQVARESAGPGGTRRVGIKGKEDAVGACKAAIEGMVAMRQAEIAAGGRPAALAAVTAPSASGGRTGVLTFKIPDDKVGLIIGRAGATINGIQTRTASRIQIPREADADNPTVRTVEVTATTDEACQAARTEIEALIEADNARHGVAHDVTRFGMEAQYVDVPDQHAGLIIGRGGETISLLQNRTGTRIQVPPQCTPGTNMRHVSVVGPPASCAQAIQEIHNLIAQSAGGMMGQRMGGYGGVDFAAAQAAQYGAQPAYSAAGAAGAAGAATNGAAAGAAAGEVDEATRIEMWRQYYLQQGIVWDPVTGSQTPATSAAQTAPAAPAAEAAAPPPPAEDSAPPPPPPPQ